MLLGPGLDAKTCESRLGIRGNFLWSKPSLPVHPRWGLQSESRTVLLAEAVEPILSQVYSVRQTWVALLDDNSTWNAELACAVTVEEREPRHDDYPCLTLERDQIRRMAELRLEFSLEFR